MAPVYNFVTHHDGVDVVPIPRGLADHAADVGVHVLDVDDPEHDLLVLLARDGEHVGDLVTVDAVDADDVVRGHGVEVGADGAAVFAGAVVAVWGIADAFTAADHGTGPGTGGLGRRW